MNPLLPALLLLALCVSLATRLELWFQGWAGNRAASSSFLQVALGDGRRLFASQFMAKADAYFHSGYYPSMFDAPLAEHENHLVQGAGAKEAKADDHAGHGHAASAKPNPKHGEAGHVHEDHDEEPDFLGHPRDWIERVGRHFFVSEHTHLEKADAREILPWMRLSATLDPNRVDTYTTASFWLRSQLGKAAEAEQFLREGLQANPGSPELYFELGRIYAEDRKDPARARNLWDVALERWRKVEAGKPEPDKLLLLQIVSGLALLERTAGNYERSLALMQLWKPLSAQPAEVDKWIADLREKMVPQPK